MNVAPDQTIILGRQIFLDHRSLSSIGQKILMILHPPFLIPLFDLGCSLEVVWMEWRNLQSVYYSKIPKMNSRTQWIGLNKNKGRGVRVQVPGPGFGVTMNNKTWLITLVVGSQRPELPKNVNI